MTTPSPYDDWKFDDWVYSISHHALQHTMIDCLTFGIDRYMHIKTTGHDWRAVHPRDPKRVFNWRIRLQELIQWLYSQRFGMMVELLDEDVDRMQEYFLKLIAGPILEFDGETKKINAARGASRSTKKGTKVSARAN